MRRSTYVWLYSYCVSTFPSIASHHLRGSMQECSLTPIACDIRCRKSLIEGAAATTTSPKVLCSSWQDTIQCWPRNTSACLLVEGPREQDQMTSQHNRFSTTDGESILSESSTAYGLPKWLPITSASIRRAFSRLQLQVAFFDYSV